MIQIYGVGIGKKSIKVGENQRRKALENDFYTAQSGK